jgi:hypothetical protein
MNIIKLKFIMITKVAFVQIEAIHYCIYQILLLYNKDVISR